MTYQDALQIKKSKWHLIGQIYRGSEIELRLWTGKFDLQNEKILNAI